MTSNGLAVFLVLFGFVGILKAYHIGREHGADLAADEFNDLIDRCSAATQDEIEAVADQMIEEMKGE